MKKEKKNRKKMVGDALAAYRVAQEDDASSRNPPRRNSSDDERPGIPTPETIDQRAASSDSVAGASRNEAPPAAIETSSRRSTPQDSDNPPPRVPTPATAEDQSAAGLRRAIDNLQNAGDLSPAASPPSTPLNPRRTVNDPRASNISTPQTDKLLQELKDRMDGKTSPQKKRINSFMSKLIRDNQSRPSRPSSRTPAEELPINYQAFENYAATRGGAVVSRAARHANDPSFNLESAAGQARRRATKNIVDRILQTGDDDQISLALLEALNHKSIRPYMKRIYGEQNSEQSAVGRIAVDGMKALTERIANSKSDGGRRQECRALLKMIGMTLTESAEAKEVSQEAVIRQVFPNFSRRSAQRILKKAGEKRKRFEEQELCDFTLVEDEKKRSKYSSQQIDELRNWMLTNDYSRDSPQAKDTIRERDIHGMSCRSLLMYSFLRLAHFKST